MSFKILHVYRSFFPDTQGGVEEAIRQIAIGTKKFGVKNRVLTLSPNPVPRISMVSNIPTIRSKRIFSLRSCDVGFLNSFRQFRELSKWADIVHYHFPWPFADLLNLFGKISRPTLMTYHSDVIDKGILGHLYRPLMLCMLNDMDAIVSTSEEYIKSSEVLGLLIKNGKKNISTIPLGIDEESYSPNLSMSARVDVKKKYGLDAGEYFLFIGSDRKYKTVDSLLDATIATGLKVVFIGKSHENSTLKISARQHHNISHLGDVCDVDKLALLSSCRALILPSSVRSEAYGMVLVEASMLGKPMITCEIGTGTSYVNKGDITGIVVEPHSSSQIAKAMTILYDDPSLTQRMGAAARCRYEDKLLGNLMSKRYLDLYTNVLEK